MLIHIIIGIISVILVIYIIQHDERMTGILLLAFALRLFLMAADLGHWFPILNSGADTEMFDAMARRSLRSLNSSVQIGGYPRFLSLIYSVSGSSRLLAQFINVLFGMGILFILVKIFRLLDIPMPKQKIALCAVAFLPNMAIFSGILLREAWVEFFVALSAFQFILWYIKGKQSNMIMCILSVLAASYMHSGVIGLLGGYIVGFLAYDPRVRAVQFTLKTILIIVVLGILFLVFAGNSAVFLGKFQTFDPGSSNEFLKYANKIGTGSSGYLTWLPPTSNPIIGLLVAPLRMFYFLFAPLPTEWHRVSDVIGFVIDGSIYMWMCWFILKKCAPVEYVYLKKFLVASFLTAAFIFGYGTSNAGTAFRHRAKLMPVIAMTFALSQMRENEEDESDSETCDINTKE